MGAQERGIRRGQYPLTPHQTRHKKQDGNQTHNPGADAMRRRDCRRGSHGGSSGRHCVTARHRTGSGGSGRTHSGNAPSLPAGMHRHRPTGQPDRKGGRHGGEAYGLLEEGDPRRGVPADQLLHQLPALHRAADGEDGHGRAEPELQDGLRQQLEHGLLGLHAPRLPHPLEGDTDQRHPDPGQPRERPRVAPQSR